MSMSDVDLSVVAHSLPGFRELSSSAETGSPPPVSPSSPRSAYLRLLMASYASLSQPLSTRPAAITVCDRFVCLRGRGGGAGVCAAIRVCGVCGCGGKNCGRL